MAPVPQATQSPTDHQTTNMSQGDSQRLTQDVAFDLLSSPRRRYVINYLQQGETPVELGTLAEEVAAWENETSIEELTSKQKKRVYVSLYQTHVPKLEDYGVVSYDEDAGTVSMTDRIHEFDRYLTDGEDETEWEIYYLVLAVASGIIYAALALGLVSLAPIAQTAVAGGIMVAFFAVAVVHWLDRQTTDNDLESLIEIED